MGLNKDRPAAFTEAIVTIAAAIMRGAEPGGMRYDLTPQTALFRYLHCAFPMGDRQLQIDWEHGEMGVQEA